MENNKFYQDNMSNILMENNDISSISMITEHIKARYLLIREHINQGDVEVEYYPTENIWSDVLKKTKKRKGFLGVQRRANECQGRL